MSLPELRNMEYTNHQYTSKTFQFPLKRLGMSATNATFSMEAYKTIVFIWRMFMISSMKVANHLGPDFQKNIRRSAKTQDSRTL